MKLGISSPLKHGSPQEWASKHKALGLEAVVFPVDHLAGEEAVMAYKAAADEAGLSIAEVGVWRNTLAADPAQLQAFKRPGIAEYPQRLGQMRAVGRAGTARRHIDAPLLERVQKHLCPHAFDGQADHMRSASAPLFAVDMYTFDGLRLSDQSLTQRIEPAYILVQMIIKHLCTESHCRHAGYELLIGHRAQ